jgi:hypothetical protein
MIPCNQRHLSNTRRGVAEDVLNRFADESGRDGGYVRTAGRGAAYEAWRALREGT